MVKAGLKTEKSEERKGSAAVDSRASLSREGVDAESAPKKRASLALIILAFAAVYLIWGSTYLGIKYAIGTLPPFLMAGTRFLVAGAILFAWASFRGERADTSRRSSLTQWRRAFIVGALLFLCGNGGVTWAEIYVPSGLAALLVATEPLWIVLLNWAVPGRQGGARPNAKVFLGLFAGLAGVALLFSGGLSGGTASTTMSLISAGVVIAAGFAWAGGSLYSVRRPIQASAARASGMQMLAGGVLLLLMGLITGEYGKLQLSSASWLSIGAFVYLIVFGSIVAFTAYSWLLQTVTPASAATYAYVNPVVAVLLGWAIASEPVTVRMLVAAAVIVGSVALITTYGKEKADLSGAPSGPSNSEEGSQDLNPCPNHPCA